MAGEKKDSDGKLVAQKKLRQPNAGPTEPGKRCPRRSGHPREGTEKKNKYMNEDRGRNTPPTPSKS